MTDRPPCSHWTGRECALGLFGGRPSPGVCRGCDRYDGPDRGLGDTVHRLAQATGIAAVVEFVNGGPCGGCEERRRQMNGAEPPG
jgi:hypothetical protein